MARRRLAACLVLPEPHRTEVDGLRRATGGEVARIPPHITLVPPVNVREEAWDEALEVLRRAAGAQPGPLDLVVGPAATFAPVNRVVYLAVDGDATARARLRDLRAALLVGPLERDERRRFIPHVTLSHRLPEGDDAHALAVLGRYEEPVRFAHVELLTYDDEARRWGSWADARMGPVRVTGRGGIETELGVSAIVPPDVVAGLAAWEVRSVTLPDSGTVVTGRRGREVVGVAVGGVERWGARRVGRVDGVVVAPPERGAGLGRHLVTTLAAELADAGAERIEPSEDADDATRALADAVGLGAPQP
ncbi:2'-5' RNA ligase family protein [Actinomarinicola tropica]|uniref:2'-5' RNA ligase family protein n=1 Tax=Actinomarinicola tropica TaxID=2789776 RepID=UPI00189B98EC|nr:2'-5' RNA ligase family protein [Actinomarinicola tropica]